MYVWKNERTYIETYGLYFKSSCLLMLETIGCTRDDTEFPISNGN